jgi:hypothetical protein
VTAGRFVRTRKITGWLAVVLTLCATAGVGEGVNPPPDYPAPQCARPQKESINRPQPAAGPDGNVGMGRALRDPGGGDSRDLFAHNERVKAYNRGAQNYNACMSSYIDTANGEIKRLHDEAAVHVRQVADEANGRIKEIETEIREVVDEANGAGAVSAANGLSQYPPSECKKPAALSQARRTIAQTARYDQDDRAYRSCVTRYIAQASSEIKQIQDNATGGTRQIAQTANSRIGLIKERIHDAIAGADRAASAEAAGNLPGNMAGGEITLAALPPDPGTESVVVTGERIKRSVDTPTGEGDPDAISCRLPQQLPDSRIPGPEICKRNRDWASLHKAGSDISSDGRSLVPSEATRTTNRASMNCTKVTTGSAYTGYMTNEYCN